MTQALTPSALLQNAPVSVTLTTTDLQRSLHFYTTKLGIRASDTTEHSFQLNCGNSTSIYVYLRDEPPQATNTVCAFRVDDLDATVEALRNNGVEFQEYDLPDLKTINGIANLGDDRVAWINDPDGNVIGIGNS